MTELTPQEIARGCLLRIVAQPARYNQGTWQTVVADQVDPDQRQVSCPTTGCVAGTAAMLAGDTGLITYSRSQYTINGKKSYNINEVLTAAGDVKDIRTRGAELLALTYEQSAWLFSAERTLPEVVNALIELSQGQPLSHKRDHSMSKEEKAALMKYRVPRAVKRQHAPANEMTPTRKKAVVHE